MSKTCACAVNQQTWAHTFTLIDIAEEYAIFLLTSLIYLIYYVRLTFNVSASILVYVSWVTMSLSPTFIDT